MTRVQLLNSIMHEGALPKHTSGSCEPFKEPMHGNHSCSAAWCWFNQCIFEYSFSTLHLPDTQVGRLHPEPLVDLVRVMNLLQDRS